VGAVAVNLLKSWLTGEVPEAWLFVLGALFVLVTLVFPRGLVGLAQQLKELRHPVAPVAAGNLAK